MPSASSWRTTAGSPGCGASCGWRVATVGRGRKRSRSSSIGSSRELGGTGDESRRPRRRRRPPRRPSCRPRPRDAPRRRLRLSLEAGGGLWTRRPGTGTTSAFGVRVAWANVEAALSVLAPRAPAAERPADGGEVEVSALGMAITPRSRLGGCTAAPSRRPDGDRLPRIGAHPRNRGSRRERGDHGRARAGGGRVVAALGGLSTWASRPASATRCSAIGSWSADGGQSLPPPPWQGVVLARLGYTFSP